MLSLTPPILRRNDVIPTGAGAAARRQSGHSGGKGDAKVGGGSPGRVWAAQAGAGHKLFILYVSFFYISCFLSLVQFGSSAGRKHEMSKIYEV